MSLLFTTARKFFSIAQIFSAATSADAVLLEISIALCCVPCRNFVLVLVIRASSLLFAAFRKKISKSVFIYSKLILA